MNLWQRIYHFASLVRFSHTLFALPFALSEWTLLWRKQKIIFSWPKLFYVILAFSAFRSFAMAVNRIADANFDAQNPRTQNREIPRGILSQKTVFVFAILSLILGMFFALLLNPLAFYLSPLAVVILAGYSYSKRFTWLCHFWLGAAIGLAPIAVSLALTEQIGNESFLLFAVLLFYISGFDILYALQDQEFDQRQKLYSIPARFGQKKAQIISLLSHFLVIVLLFYLAFLENLGWMYYIFFVLIFLLIIKEHSLIGIFSNLQKEKIPEVFFSYNSAISISLFLGIFLDTIIYFYA